MSFSPILSNQPLSYAENRYQYRNAPRENAWGSPVFACGPNTPTSDYISYPGPKYQYGYNYYNSPATNKGNCTWWCWCRCLEANGTSLSLHLGDAKNWYDNYSGSKERNADNIQPGDIIVFTDSNAGHVQFVEQVSGNTVYISQSAYSTRAVWNDKSCLVTSYSKSEIYQGSTLDMYRNLDTPAYETVVGVLHTGGVGPGPEPPEPTVITPFIDIDPSSYNVTMDPDQDTVDFTFIIVIEGIPSGYTAGGNTYPGLTRIYNTGWSYTDYTGSDGNTYRQAYKTQTLQYARESLENYTVTKHMYFNLDYPNGSIHTDTPMTIHVEVSTNLIAIILKTDKEDEYMIKLI